MNIFHFGKRAIAYLLAFLIFFTNTAPVWAHPLGNFTINHYARLEPDAQELRVRYVLDYAEIPTFQEKQRMGMTPDGTIAPRARDAYLAERVPQLANNLVLTIDGQPVALELVPGTAQLDFLAGQGGLQVMRLAMWLRAPLTPNSAGIVIAFADKNYSERLGWREIVARAGEGITLKSSTVPTHETSQELTQYPADRINNPPDQRQATLVVILGAGAAKATLPSPVAAGVPGALGALDRTRDDFAKLITTEQELSPAVLAVSLLAAIALGALHAFSPGHGKAVVGAYLVGSRGNWQHAIFLGSVVTATHTVGVYALGLVTLFLSAYILPEQLLPALGFLSGLLVSVIGAQLLLQRWRAARTHTTSFDHARQVHAHDDGHMHEHSQVSLPHVYTHEHDTAHSHAHVGGSAHEHIHAPAPPHVHTRADGATHTHTHTIQDAHDHEHLDTLTPSDNHTHDFATPEEEAAHARAHLAKVELLEKPSWRNLLSLGISGGLVPCPSALVVMLSAIGLGRVLFGLYLIVGFSLGLAGVLVLTGLALLYAGKFAGRLMRGERTATIFRYAPILGAAVVMVLGIGIALDALWQSGWFK